MNDRQQKNDEAMHALLSRQNELKERELKKKEEENNKRRLLPLPTDLSLPEFDDKKIQGNAKALLFYVSVYLNEVRQACEARLPDLIEYSGSRKAAGRWFYILTYQVVCGEFSQLQVDRNYKYSADTELRVLKRVEKHGLSDIHSWTLTQLQKVMPTDLINDGTSGDVNSADTLTSATDREGPLSPGYILWRLLKSVHQRESDVSKWTNHVNNHKLKGDLLTFTDFLTELHKYKS